MDRKSAAIVVGASVGAAAVAIIGYELWRSSHPHALSVNEAVEKARDTVRQLNDALDAVRGSS